jgi:pimeloyl-ACP methyl ester carboxylesterase
MGIQFVERRNVRLWSEGLGKPGRPCALLISGAGAHAEFWPDEFCHRLTERGLFVIRYHHRDTGHSTYTTANYDIYTLLADLLAILDAHHVHAAHFVGHSSVLNMNPMRGPHRNLSSPVLARKPD